MKVFDCFAGIGGFRLGFEREGYQIIGFCEKDKFASQLYKAYYNTDGEYHIDNATKIIPSELPDFDVFTGGFPCQAFSIAGKRRGFKDTRGTLFFEIARICETKKPKHIVLENVKGLLSHDRGATFTTIIRILTDLGYSVQWMVLNSKCFGVPQNRKRVYIVGHLGEKTRPKIFSIGKTKEICFKSDENPKKVYNIASTLLARQYVSWNGNFLQTSQGIRQLTPLECFRLQGFPDGIVQKAYEIGISDAQLYKMAGNAVTVNVVQEIAKRLRG